MTIDIVFPASSRPEFTAASLLALARNTNWALVRRLIIFTDGSPFYNGCVAPPPIPIEVLEYDKRPLGGPVAIMKAWLADKEGADVMAKIDNDVIVPPGWLDEASGVMDHHPGLDILGLEPPLSRTAAPWARGKRPPAPELNLPGGAQRANPGYATCDSIGGVGLMRRRAFATRAPMLPHSTYGGFTDWQQRHSDLVIGWIVPPLDLFLLDRLPIEPWAALSRQYIAQGDQRPWSLYLPEDASLWQWWLDSQHG